MSLSQRREREGKGRGSVRQRESQSQKNENGGSIFSTDLQLVVIVPWKPQKRLHSILLYSN